MGPSPRPLGLYGLLRTSLVEMNGFGPTSLGVWIHSFLGFSRHVVKKGGRPWLRRAPSECAYTWRLIPSGPIHHVPLAVHVPMNPEEIVPEGAFRVCDMLVLSQVSGWSSLANCRQLRIVKLPATVVGISDNVFRDCKLLNSVSAPGCRDFGHKAFAECCSLQWVYASEGVANMFSNEAKFGQYLLTLLSLPCVSFHPPCADSPPTTLLSIAAW